MHITITIKLFTATSILSTILCHAEMPTCEKLPWSPEEIEKKLSETWPARMDSGDTPGSVKLHRSRLKAWQKKYLQGSPNALLDEFKIFEAKVKQFSREIEETRNHRDPHKRPSIQQMATLDAAYQELFEIVRGKGGYLGIYRKWVRQYTKERIFWERKL